MAKKSKKRLKKLPIFILLVLIAVGGYFAYTKIFSGESSDIEKVVKPKEKVDIINISLNAKNKLCIFGIACFYCATGMSFG